MTYLLVVLGYGPCPYLADPEGSPSLVAFIGSPGRREVFDRTEDECGAGATDGPRRDDS